MVNLILFAVLLILTILVIIKAKKENNKDKFYGSDNENKKIGKNILKKLLGRILFFIIIGFCVTFLYLNRVSLINKFILPNRFENLNIFPSYVKKLNKTNFFIEELKENGAFAFKIFLKENLENGNLSEEIITSAGEEIKNIRPEIVVDLLSIVQQPYENMGVFYKDTKKTLEKRKAGNREYLYNIKGKKGPYTGKLTEKIEHNKIKVSKYTDGFLMEYRIYDGVIEDINMLQVKRYYKSGNERINILLNNGAIEFVDLGIDE